MTAVKKIQVGGIVVPIQSLYVERTQDEVFLSAVRENCDWLNVYGCRTMGKSSLYAQHKRVLEDEGWRVIAIDLSAQDLEQYTTSHELICGLGKKVASQLLLNDPSLPQTLKDSLIEPLKSLPETTSASEALECLIRSCLSNVDKKVLLVLDEYDEMATLPYCGKLVTAFRNICNLRSEVEEFRNFSICFVGLKPLVTLADLSPFTFTLEMRDFEKTQETVKRLSEGFIDQTIPGQDVLYRLLDLSGGQPLVTMTLLKEVVRNECRTPAEVESLAFSMVSKSGEGKNDLDPFKKIQRDFEKVGADAYASLHTYQAILRGSPEAHYDPDAELLLTMGLVKKERTRLKPKGRLFKRRFDTRWADLMISRVSEKMPPQYRGATTTRTGKRICVINTGGTLGMVQEGEKVVAPKDSEIFRKYFSSLNAIAEQVEFINLFQPRDSINVFPNQWVKIARYIYERRHDGFDGFVVAHGTDTMAFSASAVAFALGPNLSFPVVFTGAQTTVDVAHGDAHVNLYRACEVAKLNIPEVVICFGHYVYRAVRAQKIDDRRFEGFASPTYPPLAEITGEITVRRELIRTLPTPGEDIKLQANFRAAVLLIQQFPGLKPQLFEQQLPKNGEHPDFQGVILQSFGAGNVANLFPYSFMSFINRAVFEHGIPVIVTSQYPPDPGAHTMYAPAEAPIDAGAIHAGNMTLAAAVAKFHWVLAKVRRRADWEKMHPRDRRNLVSQLMVEESVVGEF